MVKKLKTKKKSPKQLKALRELRNIVTGWTDKDFQKWNSFSEYLDIQRKKNKKIEKLLTDADIENLSIPSFTNYLEDNSFNSEEENDNDDSDYDRTYSKKKKNKKQKQKKSNVKKPLTAFNFFCKEKGNELRKSNPSLRDHDFWSALAEEWKKLNEKEKQIYVKKSENDKIRYQNEINKEQVQSKKIKKKKKK